MYDNGWKWTAQNVTWVTQDSLKLIKNPMKMYLKNLLLTKRGMEYAQQLKINTNKSCNTNSKNVAL